jgi:hypothetical protein
MFKFFGWLLNSRVVPTNGLRLFLLFRYRVENNPHLQAKKIVGFSRRDLSFSTGLSYNSVQDGLKQLQTLGLIQLDPLDKGSKHLARLTEPTEYNWEMIQDRLGFRFKSPVVNDDR